MLDQLAHLGDHPLKLVEVVGRGALGRAAHEEALKRRAHLFDLQRLTV